MFFSVSSRFYEMLIKLYEKKFLRKSKDLAIFILPLCRRAACCDLRKFLFHILLTHWRQQFTIKWGKGTLHTRVKMHFHTWKNIYYLSPQRYQGTGSCDCFIGEGLSWGLEWSKARMVGHLRCLTQRTEDKGVFSQKGDVDGAQHPLPT